MQQQFNAQQVAQQFYDQQQNPDAFQNHDQQLMQQLGGMIQNNDSRMMQQHLQQ